MKSYVVVILQFIIWSGYTLTEWLSQHDQMLYNILMFFVFAYLAILAGNIIVKSTRKTILLTVFSLFLYSSIQYILEFI